MKEEQLSVLQAEALAAFERASGSAVALENHIDAGLNALRSVGDEREREAAKIRELLRLTANRLAGLVRRFGEGGQS